jgi:hypothetical protein
MSTQGGTLGTGTTANLTTEQIKAHGDVKTRIAMLWFVGLICGILAIGGIAAFFINPDSAKDVWVIIGPIISAALSGTVSYFAGERSSS